MGIICNFHLLSKGCRSKIICDSIGERMNRNMKALSLKDIQEESLKILIDVHSFCESNDIKYSLAYGTLIGAVRHGGFIPWDDDIDIIMPRPEYERFCSTYHSDDYQLICKENDKTCMMGFAKVCDVSRTLATDSPWTRKKVGISIDVFPLDGAEDDFSQFASRYKKVQNIWTSLFVNRALQSGVRKENSAKLNLMIRFLDLTGLQSINRKLARHKVNEMDAAAKSLSFDKANHYTMMVFCDDGTRSYYDKKDFESLVTISFEGHDFYAFSGYDGILRAVFDDYMQLPPIEKRIPAHKSKFYWK